MTNNLKKNKNMAAKSINITLKIWRQKNCNAKGQMETYKLNDVSTASSFLEMLDQLNEQLINEQKEPVHLIGLTFPKMNLL